jgi:hypothetical protein
MPEAAPRLRLTRTLARACGITHASRLSGLGIGAGDSVPPATGTVQARTGHWHPGLVLGSDSDQYSALGTFAGPPGPGPPAAA